MFRHQAATYRRARHRLGGREAKGQEEEAMERGAERAETMKKVAPWLVSVVLVVLAACGRAGAVSPGYTASPAPRPSAGAAPWPLPSDPMALARGAGMTPRDREFFTFHVHAHLDVFVNGRPVQVPGGIGIDIADPMVHRGVIEGAPAYGAPAPGRGCPRPCISPLHTHDVTGVIHIEAPTKIELTLGQLLREWGVRLDGSCVGGYCRPASSVVVFVDGKRQAGNPGRVQLLDHDEIAIVIGTPPARIPDTYAFEPNEP
jgi:hypothetical protein